MPSGIGLASGSSISAGSSLSSLSSSVPVIGGIINSVLGGILQHARRAKGATNQANAVAQAVPQFDQQLKQINDAYNNGSLTPSDAIQGVEYIGQQYYQDMAPYEGQPGTATRQCNALSVRPLSLDGIDYIQGTTGSTPCDKLCTSTCCVGCNVIQPAVAAATAVLQRGGGNSWVDKVYGSKYASFTREGYGLTWNQSNSNPITAVSGLGNQIINTIEGAFTSITGGGVNGGAAGQYTTTSPNASMSPTAILLLVLLVMGLFFGLRSK